MDEYGLRVVDDAVLGHTQGCGFSPAATSAGSVGSMATTNGPRRSNQLRAGPYRLTPGGRDFDLLLLHVMAPQSTARGEAAS